MASNFASHMGNSSGFSPVKFLGFRIPGVGVARGVTGVAGSVIVVPVQSLDRVHMNNAYLS